MLYHEREMSGRLRQPFDKSIADESRHFAGVMDAPLSQHVVGGAVAGSFACRARMSTPMGPCRRHVARRH